MSASTKLSNSVKALCYLARHYDEPQSSNAISRSTGVNASKIRKLLSDLAKIGVVNTTQGKEGGFRLAKSASDIHLQEIYCGIEDRKAFHLDISSHGRDSEPEAINEYFLDLFSEIQVEIEDKMRNITLADIISQVISPNIT